MQSVRLEHATSDSLPATALPRVLIYSTEIPQTGLAGGILLDRLFQGYPTDQVRVVGPPAEKLSAPSRFIHHVVSMPWRKIEMSRFNVMHRSLRSYGAVALKSPEEIDRLLDGFQPQVVVTVMQFGTWYLSSMRYAQSRNLPLVCILHDDNECFEPVYRWARKARRRTDGRFYRYACRRLCVSPEMEEECSRRYGVRGEVMYPNRSEDLSPRDPALNIGLRTPGRLNLGFVGNTQYGYGEQLVRMVPALRAAGVKLVVYGPWPRGEAAPLCEATDVVELRGFVPSSEAWDGVQRDCDAMVFPYLDPPGRMEVLYSSHFPSKLPEYLTLGMPIVMVGPESATGVRWVRRHPDAALLLDNLNPCSWPAALEILRDSAPLRESLALNAVKAGGHDFDPVKIRRRFQMCLAEAARSTRQ
jgi:glycosyltransferase involved in cell wall biosynthesis